MAMSALPSASASSAILLPNGMYFQSVNPSKGKNSSARYCGAMQMKGACARRRVVVSGGGSAAAERQCSPSRPAAPRAEVRPRNSRRPGSGILEPYISLPPVRVLNSPSRMSPCGLTLVAQLLEECSDGLTQDLRRIRVAVQRPSHDQRPSRSTPRAHRELRSP